MIPNNKGKFLSKHASNQNMQFFDGSECENRDCFVCGNRFLHKKSLVESHGQVHGDQGHCSETTIQLPILQSHCLPYIFLLLPLLVF